MSWQKLQGINQRVRYYLQILWKQLPSLCCQWQVNRDTHLLSLQRMQAQNV